LSTAAIARTESDLTRGQWTLASKLHFQNEFDILRLKSSLVLLDMWLDGGNMSNIHYQLIPCKKCAGELYGPIGVKLELAVPLEAQIESIETAVSSSHPHHEVNGSPLKRYSDFQFPQY